MGFDKKYGIKITPSKEASWAAVRDKVANGELHVVYILYGMVYGVQLGIGGQQKIWLFWWHWIITVKVFHFQIN